MAYANLADIQGMIAKFTINGTSSPSSAQAANIIGQISAEIDSMIADAGYAVPVTTPAWFVDALKLLNGYGAAALILRSMFPDARGSGESAVAEYSYYATEYSKGLKRLQEGVGIPPEVPSSSGMVSASTYFTRNPDSEETLGVIAEPFFKRSSPY